MNYYPILIPTLNRYEKFKNCIESLQNNIHSNETELIIGLDYPPSEKYLDGYKKIKDYIKQISGFKTITIFEREKNFGSYKNSEELKNYAFSKYDSCIFTEDDNIFNSHFLDYMNSALNYYKDDETVFAISGYSYPIDWKTNKDCVLQSQYFSAWGMGIWKNKEIKYKSFLNKKIFRKQFRSFSNTIRLLKSHYNLYQLYYFCFSENIPICDITRSGYILFSKQYTLMPTRSLVFNDGWDNSGEHCNQQHKELLSTEINHSNEIDIKNVEIVKSKELEKKLLPLMDIKKFKRISFCFIIVSIFGFWPFDLFHFIKSRIKK